MAESSISRIIVSEESFALEIETLFSEGLTYLEAIVLFCKKHDIDMADALKLITKPLRNKIEYECGMSGLLKEKLTKQVDIGDFM